MSVIIYHNPHCSKSRQTLQLIQEQDIEPVIVEYLETPPTEEELDHILSLLNMEPRDLMRKKEKDYKAAGLDKPELTHKQLIRGMVQHPKVIERPIVLNNGKATIGRPPENVLEIL